MMYRKTCLTISLLISFGCGESPAPVAGGKTTDHWVKELHDPKPEVRLKAVRKLGNIAQKDRTALPSIYESLSDDAPAVRKEAIYGVVRNWPASRDALPILEGIMKDDTDSDVRSVAVEAYENLISTK